MARSLTTPTSRTRSGNGPTRSVRDEEDLAELAVLHALRRSSMQRGVEALDVADRRRGRRRAAHDVDELAAPPRPWPPAASRRARATPAAASCADGGAGAPRWARRRSRSPAPAGASSSSSGREDAARRRDGAEAVAAGIDGAGERDARGGLQQAGVVAADHAQPEHRAAQRGCRDRWRVTAPTRVSAMAATRRPASCSAPTAQVGRGRELRRPRRRPRRRRDRRRRRHPGRRDPRQAADARAARRPPRRGGAGRRCVIGDGRRRSARRRSSSPAPGSAPGAIVGDQAFVRERSRDRRGLGRRPRLGRSTTTSSSATACGSRPASTSRPSSVIEDDVFVGPCAMTTNDDTMGRHAPRRAAARRDAAPRLPHRRRRRARAGRRDRRGGVRRRRRRGHQRRAAAGARHGRPGPRRARRARRGPARAVVLTGAARRRPARRQRRGLSSRRRAARGGHGGSARRRAGARLAGEVARVLAPRLGAMPKDAAGRGALREAVADDRRSRAGYRDGHPARERALQPLGVVQRHASASRALSTHAASADRGTLGPFRNMRVGRAPHPPLRPGHRAGLPRGRHAIADAQRAASMPGSRSVRRGRGADAGRVGAAARARRRLLVRGGHRQRADHARRVAMLLGRRAGLRVLRRGEQLRRAAGGGRRTAVRSAA